MPLPVLFPKLYLQLTIEGRTVERSFTEVKSLAWWVREIVSGTYRNGENWAPGRVSVMPATGMVNIPADAYPTAREVPVFGLPGVVQSYNYTQLTHAAPDEVLNVPPRPLHVQESGLLIGMTDAALPTPTVPVFASLGFTINVTSNLCTTPSVMPFDHGDIVAVMATTLPTAVVGTPFSSSATYTLLKLSTTTFLLRNMAGQIIDFNAAGAGCVAVLVTSARLPPPEPTGFFFYRESWQPRIFTDAALTNQVTV